MFFFYSTATTDNYTYRHTLSLHDSLPISNPLIYDPALALELACPAAERYVDAHCSVFTPFGFVELCRGIAGLDLFPYRFAAFLPTPADQLEFLVLLEATEATPTIGGASGRERGWQYV